MDTIQCRKCGSIFKTQEELIVHMNKCAQKLQQRKEIIELRNKYYGPGGGAKIAKHNVTQTTTMTGDKKVYLYPLYLEMRGQKKTDEEIIVKFKEAAPDKKETYLKNKLKFFREKKGV